MKGTRIADSKCSDIICKAPTRDGRDRRKHGNL